MSHTTTYFRVNNLSNLQVWLPVFFNVNDNKIEHNLGDNILLTCFHLEWIPNPELTKRNSTQTSQKLLLMWPYLSLDYYLVSCNIERFEICWVIDIVRVEICQHPFEGFWDWEKLLQNTNFLFNILENVVLIERTGR